MKRVFRDEDGETSDGNVASESQVAPSSIGHNPFLDVCHSVLFCWHYEDELLLFLASVRIDSNCQSQCDWFRAITRLWNSLLCIEGAGVFAPEKRHKGNNAPSLMYPLVDERNNEFSGWLSLVGFGALSFLKWFDSVGWVTERAPWLVTNFCHYRQEFSSRPSVGRTLVWANSGSPGKLPRKWRWWYWVGWWTVVTWSSRLVFCLWLLHAYVLCVSLYIACMCRIVTWWGGPGGIEAYPVYNLYSSAAESD